MGKSVKLLDVQEEWRDARTRLKELEVVAGCEIVTRDHGPAKKVVVFHPRGRHNQWLRVELGPFCWDLIDYTAKRDGTWETPSLAMSTDDAFFQIDGWLRQHGCL